MKRLFFLTVASLATSGVTIAQNSNPWPTTGNVGIGVTTPANKLTVAAGENNRAIEITGGANYLYNETSTTHFLPALSYYANQSLTRSNPSSEIVFADRPGTAGYPNAARTSDMLFYTAHSFDPSTNSFGIYRDLTMIIKSAQGGGSVGIGTPTPLNKFNVVGDSYSYADPQYTSGVRVNDAANTTAIVMGVASNENDGYIQTIQPDISWDSKSLILQPLGGYVGIGTKTPDPAFKLSVNGSVRAKEIKVETGWSDYVFDEAYKLKPIAEVEAYIKQNHHLPDVPSAAEVEQNGVNLGETSSILLKKIEELTLYLIEQKKEVEDLKAQIKLLNGKKNLKQPKK